MITVYTCIAGGYDSLINQRRFNNVKYICFCDVSRTERHRGWDLLPFVSPPDLTAPNLINRYHKMLAYDYFDSEFSVYIDGNVLLKADPTFYIKYLKQKTQYLGMFRHPQRENISQELKTILAQGRIGKKMIPSAVDFVEACQREGFYNQNGLSGNYIIVRERSNEALKLAMQNWWEIVLNIVDRDQLSLQYILWKAGLTWTALDLAINPRKAYTRIPHGYYLPLISLNGQAFLKKAIIKLKLKLLSKVK